MTQQEQTGAVPADVLERAIRAATAMLGLPIGNHAQIEIIARAIMADRAARP